MKMIQSKTRYRLTLWSLSLQITCLLMTMISISCGDLIEADLSLEEGYQVFGLQVDPPIVRPEGTIVVTAYDHHPRLQNFDYRWSLCLYSHGASGHFECLNELSLPLRRDKTPRVVIDLSERGIDLRKRLRALGQSLNTNGERRSLEDGLDIFVILNSGLPTEGRVQTIKRIRVHDVPGEAPLAENPKLTEWTVTESGVANTLPPCVMKPDIPLSTLRYNETGEVIAGTLRESVLHEVTGQVVEESEEQDTEEEKKCTLHNTSVLDVIAGIRGDYEREWSLNEGYTYRWYISDQQKVLTPISEGGLGIAQFELTPNLRSIELYFTVRDPNGGFAAGRQEIQLVEGISIR